MTVELTDGFEDAVARQYLWLVLYRPAGLAWAWELARKAAMADLADDPDRHPRCTDPAVRNRGLRQRAFGVGRTKTHRLVFEIDGVVVRLQTVRGLAQDDLIPDDLR